MVCGRQKIKALYAAYTTDVFNYEVPYQVQCEHNNRKIRLNIQENHITREIALNSLKVSCFPHLSQAACFQIQRDILLSLTSYNVFNMYISLTSPLEYLGIFQTIMDLLPLLLRNFCNLPVYSLSSGILKSSQLPWF